LPVVAAVLTDIADARGGDGRRLHGTAEQRLVDIAEANTKLCQFIQNQGLDPTPVTDFNNQRVVGEAMVKAAKVCSILGFISEGPRELDQESAETVGFHQWPNAVLE
jgi:hypothetical protein